MSKMRLYFLLFVALLVSSCSHLSFKNKVKLLHDYDLTDLNISQTQLLQADLVFIQSNNGKISWSDFKAEFIEARRIFKKYGVHLNLIQAVKLEFPGEWNGIQVEKKLKKPKVSADFYEKIAQSQNILPKKAQKIFHALIDQAHHPERTIYIINLSDLIISWYEKKNNDFKIVSSKTSAISFPSYLFGKSLEGKARGVISMQQVRKSHKTLAHELGHKLINVSHEGLNVCPQGDGKNIPGLMGYGESKEIFKGKKGRFHQERLLLSPFLYRLVNGKKNWNPDYKESGYYNDPIYKNLVILPACP